MKGLSGESEVNTYVNLRKIYTKYNILVVAVSIGVGLISLSSPTFYHKFPDWLQIILNSGISAGSITAILLNLFLNGSIRAGATGATGVPEPVEPEADRAGVLPTQLSVDLD